ncbi:GntR family transcriptional regulator [Aquamicrobium sp. LC103]|uniref:GntR family transcriptional regulator n=1 Tax=Aquamicrobium sp. LC103 TaxID=1120658 RepID=UPI00063E9E16|nr:GntR family transcriptional regulator [Aquamicrobium sp. LC103]TKT76179.1 GntR family transcriptional regulator [Aquamicrobium sp. LC103]
MDVPAIDEALEKLPSHEATYRRLRDMVLFGELAPGQAVTIQGLTEKLESGMTPVREAIRRLTAEGALEFQDNRRVCVPRLTAAQLEELAFAKLALEPHLTCLALRNATPQSIAHVAAIDAELDTAIAAGDVSGYLRHNYRFHFAIYDIADAPILTAIAQSLWLRFAPSLRVVCGRIGTDNLPDQHTEAVAAMRANDADALRQAIIEDMTQGIQQVRLALANGKI